MRTLALTLAYDGTNYVGWQRQENGLAVQQLVEEAFVPLLPAGAEPPTVAGASRTDAGVHALGQVASVNLDIDLSTSAVERALNVRLPRDIRVLGVADARPGFHARHHARGKRYRYRVVTTPVVSPFDRLYVTHEPGRYDLERMQAAASAFLGRHDFASFQGPRTTVSDTVRTIARVDLHASEGEIGVDVEGDGFLRHMVRTMVGTLLEIGLGRRRVEDVKDALAVHDRRAAGRTAPASGLTLVGVSYAETGTDPLP